MQPLGNNRGGYRGETIDIAAVLAEGAEAAREHGWAIEQMGAIPGLDLLAFRRPAPGLRSYASRVYLSTGIHGDEPAGPLAVRQLLRENRWPAGLGLWLCPCLNPMGFKLNRRENGAGVDLNREYREPRAAETVAHVAWLERQPRFDLCLCLHEDWESRGFYVYELNPDRRPSLAGAIISGAEKVCPIDDSEMIEGRTARNGIIRPDIDPASRPQWPEAFFLLMQKTRLSYTLEAPSDFPLEGRVAALVAAVRAALEGMGEERG